MDFGIRCVISTSFGDIFYNNCFKNGVLPIRVSPEDLEKLFDDADRGANATLSIDLEKQEIKGPDGGTVKFEIDAHRKHCMLNGLDDIGLTKLKADKIVSYEQKGARSAAVGVTAANVPSLERSKVLQLDLVVDRDVQPDFFARNRDPGCEGFMTGERAGGNGRANGLLNFTLRGEADVLEKPLDRGFHRLVARMLPFCF